MNNIVKAIGYCRITPNDKVNSINVQRQLINHASAKWGYMITEWFEQVGSGSLRYNEFALDMALDYCEVHPSIKRLVATHPEKSFGSLARYDYWKTAFQKVGVEIKFTAEDLDVGSEEGCVDMSEVPSDYDYLRMTSPDKNDSTRPLRKSVIEDLIDNLYVLVSQFDSEYRSAASLEDIRHWATDRDTPSHKSSPELPPF